jgi:zinc transport system substrate-binding protein
MNSILRPFIVSLLLLVTIAASAADTLMVYAVNYPLAYFAQRIGGDHIKLVYPVPPDTDPAFWGPNATDIAGFQQSDLILLNGAGYAKWLKHVSLPQRKPVDTSASFINEYINAKETVTHQHGPGAKHSHTGTAFTTWLDFNQAVQQARAILFALEQRRPEHTDVFRQNYAALEAELESLDKTLTAVVAQHPDTLLLASHPVYQYLARRYNIKLESVMWEPDVVPDEKEWHALQLLLDTHKAKWMIWEDEPDEKSVERLQASGISSLVFNPVASAPDDGDFISMMKTNIKEIDKAFRQ